MAFVKFSKISVVPSTDLTAGKIYFETSTGLIKVAKSDTEVDVFGGNIKDALYSNNILTISKTDGSSITLNFSDIASASAVMSVFNEIKTELSRVEGEISTQVNAAKTELIGSASDTSDLNTINAAKKYTDEKIAAIPAAITYEGDGTTITEVSEEGNVTFSVGSIDQSKVTGLTEALAGKVDKVPGSRLMTDAEGTKLADIEEGAQVNKIESIKVNEAALVISEKAVTIPNADAEVYGVITENRVKALAGEVAGSVYKVKGTKASIAEVLAVDTAAVGDVYNVTAEFTLNEQKFPAGTNVVFVGPAPVEEGEPGELDPADQAQWDALGGTVDLTPYETTAHANATYATKEALSAVESKADANTAAIGVLNGEGEGSVSKAVSDAIAAEVSRADAAYDAKGAAEGVKTIIDGYTVNGIAINTNPVLNGDNVKLSNSYAETGSYSAPAIGDKIDVAISKLAKGISDAAANGVQSIGGSVGVITLLGSQDGAAAPAVNLTIFDNELQASVVGVATAAQGAKADSALQQADITEGATNGSIAVKGVNVAVHGLGSAAYTNSDAYDAKGSADAALSSAKEYVNQMITWEEFE